jgi:hypothetical protein
MKKNMNIKILLLLTFFSLQFTKAQAQSSYVNQLPVDYELVDYKPIFPPGGFNDFVKFVAKRFVVPEIEGLSGIIKVNFVVEIDGSVTNVQIAKDIGNGTAQEAIRVILMSPKWSPGEHLGKKVRVIYKGFPIKIQN